MNLVFGKEGQVAKALSQVADSNYIFLSSAQADFLKPRQVLMALENIKPEKVIVCSAYTKVDLAESNLDTCFEINAETPKLIADWCAEHSVPMLIFSTDYVFNGEGQTPWKPTDKAEPLSAYGRSKYLMEKYVLQASTLNTVLRTSWVFSEFGNNFVKTILRLSADRPELNIVNDQVGAPTSAHLLAQFCLEWVKKPASGLFHLTNEGYVSWYEFAKIIAAEKGLKTKISAIPTSQYPTPAPRPLNCRLDCAETVNTWPELKRPRFEVALKEVLKHI